MNGIQNEFNDFLYDIRSICKPSPLETDATRKTRIASLCLRGAALAAVAATPLAIGSTSILAGSFFLGLTKIVLIAIMVVAAHDCWVIGANYGKTVRSLAVFSGQDSIAQGAKQLGVGILHAAAAVVHDAISSVPSELKGTWAARHLYLFAKDN